MPNYRDLEKSDFQGARQEISQHSVRLFAKVLARKMRYIKKSVSVIFHLPFLCVTALLYLLGTHVGSFEIPGVAEASSKMDRKPKFVFKTDFNIDWIDISPDSRYLAAGGHYGRVLIFDLTTGKVITTLQHEAVVERLSYSPDGRYLVTGTRKTYKIKNNETVNVWDAKTHKLIKKLSPLYDMNYRAHVQSLAFSPDGKYLVVSYTGSPYTKDICIFDMNKMVFLAAIEDIKGVMSSMFSPDGKRFAYSNYNEAIYIVDFASKKIKIVINVESTELVKTLAFSPSGGQLAAGCADDSVRIFDPQTGKVLHILKGHSSDVVALAYGRDGKTLYTGSYDKTLLCWNTEEGTLETTVENDKEFIFSVSVSKDGKLLAVGGGYRVTLWNLPL